MVVPLRSLRENSRRVVVWKSSISSLQELEASVGDDERNGFYAATTHFLHYILEDDGTGGDIAYVLSPNIVGGHSALVDQVAYHGGIVTNPWMVDAVIQRLWDLGVSDMTVAEGGTREKTTTCGETGYVSMMRRWVPKGVDLSWLTKPNFAAYALDEIRWAEVPDGIVHKRLPLVQPVGGTRLYFKLSLFRENFLGLNRLLMS